MPRHTDPWHEAKDQINHNQAGIGLTQVANIGTLDNKAQSTNSPKQSKEAVEAPAAITSGVKIATKTLPIMPDKR